MKHRESNVHDGLCHRAARGSCVDEVRGDAADARAVDPHGGKRGNTPAANSRSPKPTTARSPGTSRPRACASVITPRATRSELQKTASSFGIFASSAARPSRPLANVPGARAQCATTSSPRASTPSLRSACVMPSARRRARGSSPLTTPKRRLPRACSDSATSSPMRSCEKPTAMSMGEGERSQVSTTGMREAMRRRRGSGPCP